MAKELIYTVKIRAEGAGKFGSDVDRAAERAENSINEATQAQNRFNEAQESASRSSRSFAKNQSRANQVLFSYGDLINDAQQFQFGFSNGLRAIGNNVGFAAEGISNLNTKAGGFRGTLKALGSSLLGPGGVILAINVAVTAFTVFGDAIFDTNEKTKDLDASIEDLGGTVERFNRLNKELAESGIFGEDPFDITQLRAERERLIERNRENRRVLDELGASQEELNRINELRNLREADGIDLTAEQQKELTGLLNGLRAGTDVLEGYNEEISTNDTRIEQINKKLEEQKELQQDVNNTGANLKLGLSDLSKQYIETTKNISQFNDNLAQSVNATIEAQRSLATDAVEQVRLTDSVVPERDLANLRAGEVNAARRASQEIAQIKRQEVQTRIALEQQALNTISSLAQSIAPKNKALAISLIAIEKGIRIAQVVTSGIQKAAAAEAQALLFLANPATAGLAGQAFASANAIRAQTAASAALIAAQGFAQGAQAIRSGGGGGGGTSGGASRSRQQGFQTSTVERNRDFSAIRNRERDTTVVVEANNILPDTEFSIRSERGRKSRERRAVILSSDRRV